MPPFLRFESCSERVGKVLGTDVMKSVADLVPDLLAALPMLLFQGAPEGGGRMRRGVRWRACCHSALGNAMLRCILSADMAHSFCWRK